MGTGDTEAGAASTLGEDQAALPEEVAAEPGSEGWAAVCQTEFGGWGGRTCFQAARAWRPKGGWGLFGEQK